MVLRQPNRRRWDRILRILETAAEKLGVVAQPLDSSMTEGGPDLGSDSLLRLPTCKPLLVVGPGTSGYAAGALWHHLDVQMGQRTTVVDTGDFREVDLDEYTCMILPQGSFSSWGDAEVKKIRRYVETGGTVVAITSAASWLDRHKLISICIPNWHISHGFRKAKFREPPSIPEDDDGCCGGRRCSMCRSISRSPRCMTLVLSIGCMRLRSILTAASTWETLKANAPKNFRFARHEGEGVRNS